MNLHQHMALCWVSSAPWIFLPVIESAMRPDAGVVIAWGVVIVTAMIIACPMLLRWQPFKRWYDWTAAMSERQRQARDPRRYYQAAYEDGYVFRSIPYALRLIWTVAGLMALEAALPTDTGIPVLDALAYFLSWYPMGVLILIIASWPLRQLLEARLKGKGWPR